MKRLRRRVSLVAVIRLSIGMVLFGVLWRTIVGESEAVGGVAFAGLLLFLVFEAWYAGETNLANNATNARIDPLVCDVEALKRAVFGDGDDTPPHGIDVFRREGPR